MYKDGDNSIDYEIEGHFTNEYALAYHGACSYYFNILWVSSNLYDRLSFGNYMFSKTHLPDNEHFIVGRDNRGIYVPSLERAIVEAILNLDLNMDEGFLVEALSDYTLTYTDFTELYKVANFYNVSNETIDYWLQEGRDFDANGYSRIPCRWNHCG